MQEFPHGQRLVDVVPLGGVPGRYSYAVPPALEGQAVAGRRVLVPFGTRTRVGVVVGPAVGTPGGPVREISQALDAGPLIDGQMLELCAWAADYYAAPLSHALRAALPPGALGTDSLHVEFTHEGRTALREGSVPAGTRRALRAVEVGESRLLTASMRQRLVREGLLSLVHVVEAGAQDPLVEVVSLEAPAEERPIPERNRVQAEVCRRLASTGTVALDALQAAIPGARDAVRRLARHGLVRVERVPRASLEGHARTELAGPALTHAQATALTTLETELRGGRHRTFLLEGVTGSGKTEVYLRLIGTAREAGDQALVIVPEIALTPQLSARFRARFGAQVAVLHSGLTDRDRTAEWHRIHRGEAPIVVGARSALFAPLSRPRVIVVDEEHDASFKQESGLRYHGRDLAVVRGKLAGAVVVLGSATPSLETLHNVTRGRYAQVALPSRVDDRPLPAVELVDLRGRSRPRPEGGVAPSGLLSDEMLLALRETHARGEQTIVFLNRRGHSTALLCRDCGEVRRCESCSVAFTWHERRAWLICHYCGQRERAPDTCAGCGSSRLLFTGAGTEKLEDELAAAIPGARMARLDRDTAGNARQLAAVLDRFARREVDVLVGTQMVTKGHDFPGVTLVCVLLADAGLHQPDFRASERTAQLLTQVAGRAGRGELAGRVIVQTYTPEAPAVFAVVGHDYVSFARAEMAEREAVGYPPFRRLCLVRIEGEKEEDVQQVAAAVAKEAGRVTQVEVLGPAPAPRPRLRGLFRHQVLFKSLQHTGLREAIRALAALRARLPSGVRVAVDVDPVDMM